MIRQKQKFENLELKLYFETNEQLVQWEAFSDSEEMKDFKEKLLKTGLSKAEAVLLIWEIWMEGWDWNNEAYIEEEETDDNE